MRYFKTISMQWATQIDQCTLNDINGCIQMDAYTFTDQRYVTVSRSVKKKIILSETMRFGVS